MNKIKKIIEITINFLCYLLLIIILFTLANATAVNAQEPTLSDIPYGTHQRQVFDFWQAESDVPTPVFVYFHPGGFGQGGKKLWREQAAVLPLGISAISVNYRFVTEEGVTLAEVIQDAKSALSYIIDNADTFNIDNTSIIVGGVSAGGVLTMFVGFDQQFKDNIVCLVNFSGPTILEYNWILTQIGGNPNVYYTYLEIFGAQTYDQLSEEPFLSLQTQFSVINHVHAEIPPIYMQYPTRLGDYPLPPDVHHLQVAHNAVFGVLLKEQLDNLGVKNKLRFKGYNGHLNAKNFILDELLSNSNQMQITPSDGFYLTQIPDSLLTRTDYPFIEFSIHESIPGGEFSYSGVTHGGTHGYFQLMHMNPLTVRFYNPVYPGFAMGNIHYELGNQSVTKHVEVEVIEKD